MDGVTDAVPQWRLVSLALLLSLTAGAGAGAIAGHHLGADETVVTAAVAAPPADETGDSGRRSVPEVVEALAPSVVAVHATLEAEGDDIAGALTVDASGTGFVIRSDGVIATVAHVVAGAWTLHVTLPNGDRLPATLLGLDESTDLAVLQVDRDGLAPVTFGRTSDVRVGERVIAIGHALSLGGAPTVSVGTLSAVERTIANPDGIDFDHLLQTDAAINTGSSGGPLLNAAGAVIGINTSKITTDDAEGLGFAICTDHALPVLERLQAG